MFNNRRFFAVRAAIAKRENTVTINGVVVAITDRNRDRIERMRQLDAERAYEAKVMGGQHVSRFAIAA